jgi:hypothetical protein
VSAYGLKLDSGRLDEYAHRPRFAALVYVFEECYDPGTLVTQESQNTVVESMVALNESAGNFALFE